jgi:hypothetical protein
MIQADLSCFTLKNEYGILQGVALFTVMERLKLYLECFASSCI